MVATPYPTINGSLAGDGFSGMLTYSNSVIGNPLFGLSWLLAIFLVAFLGTSQFDFRIRLLYSSGIASMASVLMVALGILPQNMMFVMMLVTGALLFLNLLNREN